MSAHSDLVTDWEGRVRGMLAGAARPEMAEWGMRVLGEGQENVAVLVGQSHVVRLPKDADGAEGVAREGRLLAELSGALTLAVPRYEFTAPNPLGPGECCVYPVVPGSVLPEREWRARGMLDDEKVARAVAEFIDEVHAFPADRAREFGVEDRDMRAEFAADLELIRAQVIPLLAAADGRELVARWERYLGEDRNFEYSPVLMHGDVSLDHLLVTGDRITGVIDFGDVQIGDPDYDLSYLWPDAGAEFVRRVQHWRGQPMDERLIGKLDFWAVADAAIDVLHAIEHDMPEFRDVSVKLVRAMLARFGDHAGSV
ncbi:phosphotransferase family protein [Nocardia sp. NPDC058058]|uniref:phosphotransferase family protein n=1 Tax=Nocardia sp. NPDC058058 TaxID=3346317 RepID=UPI0036D7C4A3